MKLLVSCFSILTLALCSGRCLGDDPAHTASQPSDAAFRVHEFGLLDQDKTYDHEFVIQNKSNKDLKIVSERITCGCISIIRRPAIIPARGEAHVVVQLRTAGKRGMVRERAVLRTDDQEREYFQLTISAAVRGEWAEPDRIDFGNLSTGEVGVRELYVISSGLPEAIFLSAAGDEQHLHLTTAPATSDAQARSQQLRALRHIRVELSARELSPGPYVSSIRVMTERGGGRPIDIPVNAFLTGDMKYRPAKILWASATPGGRAVRSCVLLPEKSAQVIDPLKVTITSTHRFVEATFSPWEKGDQRGYELRATIDAPKGQSARELLSGEINGTFEGRRIFSVPYTAYVLPQGDTGVNPPR